MNQRSDRFTCSEIADRVGGTLNGQPNIRLAGIKTLERAGPGELSFLVSTRYLEQFRNTNADAVLVSTQLSSTIINSPTTLISVADVRTALREALDLFSQQPTSCWGIDRTARLGTGVSWEGRISIGAFAKLGSNVILGRDCVINDGAVIEANATIGDECYVGSNAYVGSSTKVGNRVVIKPGARIGTSGYGYTQTDDGHIRMPHLGRCILGDDVEIGSNSTVDRGSVDDTIVGPGTKVDNLVQIAHNVRIGQRCLIMSQVGLAGSTIVEDDVSIAGQAGLAGHLTIGKRARLAAQAGVIGDIPAGQTVSGYPARAHREVLRQAAALRRLTPLVSTLEKIVEKNGP